MKAGAFLAALATIVLIGCSKESEQVEVADERPPQCSKALAESVAGYMVNDVIAEVRKPDMQSQESACKSYARGLAGRFTDMMRKHEASQKAGCDDFNWEVEPEKLWMAKLEAFKSEAVKLCPRLDDEVSRQASEERGRRVLNLLPPAQRKQVEDVWENSGGSLR